MFSATLFLNFYLGLAKPSLIVLFTDLSQTWKKAFFVQHKVSICILIPQFYYNQINIILTVFRPIKKIQVACFRFNFYYFRYYELMFKDKFLLKLSEKASHIYHTSFVTHDKQNNHLSTSCWNANTVINVNANISQNSFMI